MGFYPFTVFILLMHVQQCSLLSCNTANLKQACPFNLYLEDKAQLLYRSLSLYLFQLDFIFLEYGWS